MTFITVEELFSSEHESVKVKSGIKYHQMSLFNLIYTKEITEKLFNDMIELAAVKHCESVFQSKYYINCVCISDVHIDTEILILLITDLYAIKLILKSKH